MSAPGATAAAACGDAVQILSRQDRRDEDGKVGGATGMYRKRRKGMDGNRVMVPELEPRPQHSSNEAQHTSAATQPAISNGSGTSHNPISVEDRPGSSSTAPLPHLPPPPPHSPSPPQTYSFITHAATRLRGPHSRGIKGIKPPPGATALGPTEEERRLWKLKERERKINWMALSKKRQADELERMQQKVEDIQEELRKWQRNYRDLELEHHRLKLEIAANPVTSAAHQLLNQARPGAGSQPVMMGRPTQGLPGPGNGGGVPYGPAHGTAPGIGELANQLQVMLQAVMANGGNFGGANMPFGPQPPGPPYLHMDVPMQPGHYGLPNPNSSGTGNGQVTQPEQCHPSTSGAAKGNVTQPNGTNAHPPGDQVPTNPHAQPAAPAPTPAAQAPARQTPVEAAPPQPSASQPSHPFNLLPNRISEPRPLQEYNEYNVAVRKTATSDGNARVPAKADSLLPSSGNLEQAADHTGSRTRPMHPPPHQRPMLAFYSPDNVAAFNTRNEAGWARPVASAQGHAAAANGGGAADAIAGTSAREAMSITRIVQEETAGTNGEAAVKANPAEQNIGSPSQRERRMRVLRAATPEAVDTMQEDPVFGTVEDSDDDDGDFLPESDGEGEGEGGEEDTVVDATPAEQTDGDHSPESAVGGGAEPAAVDEDAWLADINFQDFEGEGLFEPIEDVAIPSEDWVNEVWMQLRQQQMQAQEEQTMATPENALREGAEGGNEMLAPQRMGSQPTSVSSGFGVNQIYGRGAGGTNHDRDDVEAELRARLNEHRRYNGSDKRV